MQRGFVKQRGNTWTAYYYVTENGKRRQRTKTGFRTKRAASGWLTEAMAAMQRREFIEPTKLTLGEYLSERWLPLMRDNVRESTWDSYSRVIEQHVLPTLGHVPLQELRADQLDQLYAHLRREGRVDGRGGLAAKTVRYIHTTLHKALRDAERKALVSRNVAPAADPPKATTQQEMKAWTAEQVRVFLDFLKDHRLYAAYLLAVTTGMRRGRSDWCALVRH